MYQSVCGLEPLQTDLIQPKPSMIHSSLFTRAVCA